MSNSNDYGSSVTRTLQTEGTAYDLVVWQQGKPPLDSELNLLSDIHSEARRRLVAERSQSGFLRVLPFVFNPSWSNRFDLPRVSALVNGWHVDFEASGDGSFNLPSAPSGLGNHRWDFVFLEVWKALVSPGTTANKPDTTHVYRDGNVQRTAGNLDDDIMDSVVTIETTKRIQIQHRYRVHTNAAPPNTQNSNMYTGVLAQGATSAPVAGYPFTNQGGAIGDFGMWRAGDGTPAAHTQLGTVDGYVYSIPIALVFRRAVGAYSDLSSNGQNASAAEIADLVSDRPDGLFYDSIHHDDVIDLRHLALQSVPSFDEALKSAVRDLIGGRNQTLRPRALKYEAIPVTGGISGYGTLASTHADGVRTQWSDLSITDGKHVAVVHIGDTNTNKDWYTDRASGSWTSGDTITVDAPAGSPSGTVILSPSVYYNKGGVLTVTGSWAGVGTDSVVFTLGTNAGLTAEDIWVVFSVQYPSNQGLAHIPDDLLKLEYINHSNYPVVQGSYITYYGTVRNGADLLSLDPRLSAGTKQIGFEHSGLMNPLVSNHSLSSNNKGLRIAPVVSSTSSGSRVMSVKNFQNSSKKVWIPLPADRTWFIRGVYTAVSAGTEVATASLVAQVPGSINDTARTFSIPSALVGNSFAEVSEVTYLPGSYNLIGSGDYKPVFRQSAGGHIDSLVLVKTGDGSLFVPSSLSTNTGDYRITFRYLATASVNAYANDVGPEDNWIVLQSTFTATDGSELFLDIDYIAPPHVDAQLKMIYRYLPYQGLVDGTGTEISGHIKSITGLVHSDGTGNAGTNMNRLAHPRALSSYLPSPIDTEHTLAGGSVAGPSPLGKFGSSDLALAHGVHVLDLSSGNLIPMSSADVVGARTDGTHVTMERGGNEVTGNIGAMLADLNSSVPHQAVIMAAMLADGNLDIKNELVLLVITDTRSTAENRVSSDNDASLGADIFFIPGRPLVRI